MTHFSKKTCSKQFGSSQFHQKETGLSISYWLDQPSFTNIFDCYSLQDSNDFLSNNINQTLKSNQDPIIIEDHQIMVPGTIKNFQNENQRENIRVETIDNVQNENQREISIENASFSRRDIDGNSVFKLANFGLRSICKKYGYQNIIDFNGKSSQKSKDYFVLLLCQIQAKILRQKSLLLSQLPELYAQVIKPKIEKAKQNLQLATTQKEKIHAQHSLQVYQNAKLILNAYCIQKNLEEAMILAYGPMKFKNRLSIPMNKMKTLRKGLGLNTYITESQVNLA